MKIEIQQFFTVSILLQLEESKGAIFLHPFDDRYLISGYGSLGYEICQQVPDVSIVIVCCGGGGTNWKLEKFISVRPKQLFR